jgi:hypothetical protein
VEDLLVDTQAVGLEELRLGMAEWVAEKVA